MCLGKICTRRVLSEESHLSAPRIVPYGIAVFHANESWRKVAIGLRIVQRFDVAREVDHSVALVVAEVSGLRISVCHCSWRFFGLWKYL